MFSKKCGIYIMVIHYCILFLEISSCFPKNAEFTLWLFIIVYYYSYSLLYIIMVIHYCFWKLAHDFQNSDFILWLFIICIFIIVFYYLYIYYYVLLLWFIIVFYDVIYKKNAEFILWLIIICIFIIVFYYYVLLLCFMMRFTKMRNLSYD